MIQAFDVLLQIPVTADIAAKNRIDEPFRYECLCCGEEVYIAATNSTKKAPHFRHRRGNSDRECELYLGSTGIAGALNAAQKRTHSRTEIYFDIKQKIFYAAVSFPKEKLQEFEDKSCILEFHSTYNSPPYEKVRINHQNFAPDIARGYRPQAISEDRGHKLLYENSNSKLVTNMIDGLLDRWISGVRQQIEELIKAGDTESEAYIKAFQTSILPNFVELYFRLTENPVSKEYASVLSAAISIVALEKQRNSHLASTLSISPEALEKERKKYRTEIREKDSENKKKSKEIGILKAKIADLSATIETLQGELECQIIRIKQFEQTEVIQRKELHDAISVNTTLDAELKRLKAELREAQVTIDTAKKRESGQQATIDTLQSKLSEIQKVAEDLDAKIYRESDNLLCPVDIDEFSEYLGYNLSSIGVDSSTDETVGVWC